jgi:hypothetical protein
MSDVQISLTAMVLAGLLLIGGGALAIFVSKKFPA